MLTKIKWFQAVYGLLVAAVILSLFPKYSYNDPDTFWHIELGQYMIQHHTVLHHAIHTFTETNFLIFRMNSGFKSSLRVCI